MAASPQLKIRSDLAVGTDHSNSLDASVRVSASSLERKPGYAIGMLRLARPRVNTMAHVPPASVPVCREGCAPDPPSRRELSTVPVGNVADALG